MQGKYLAQCLTVSMKQTGPNSENNLCKGGPGLSPLTFHYSSFVPDTLFQVIPPAEK